jgi:non-ribosomal peptide synthase protein (TIGR01720 family)
VRFEYLGQLDGTFSGDALLVPAGEGAGRAVDPRAPRSHLLSLTGQVLGGRLRLAWSYGHDVHHRETVEALSAAFLAHLRSVIDHCRAVEVAASTPSDFPLAGIDQETLAALEAEFMVDEAPEWDDYNGFETDPDTDFDTNSNPAGVPA